MFIPQLILLTSFSTGFPLLTAQNDRQGSKAPKRLERFERLERLLKKVGAG
jgi:hypothetical protein